MPDLTLIIGNQNYSSWSLRPWVFMKTHGIPFQQKRVALFQESTRDELVLYNSDFKVPVLLDGDREVWDSLAILEYLSEQYIDGGGWPDDPGARALARSISAEMHSSFSNVRKEMPMNCRKTFRGLALSDDARAEVQRIVSLWEQCRIRYGIDGEWLFGNYSIADAMFAPVALRFAGYSIEFDGLAAEYVQSVLRHPPIQEWIAAGKVEKEVIDEDEIDPARAELVD